jgi:hypothetical protein
MIFDTAHDDFPRFSEFQSQHYCPRPEELAFPKSDILYEKVKRKFTAVGELSYSAGNRVQQCVALSSSCYAVLFGSYSCEDHAKTTKVGIFYLDENNEFILKNEISGNFNPSALSCNTQDGDSSELFIGCEDGSVLKVTLNEKTDDTTYLLPAAHNRVATLKFFDSILVVAYDNGRVVAVDVGVSSSLAKGLHNVLQLSEPSSALTSDRTTIHLLYHLDVHANEHVIFIISSNNDEAIYWRFPLHGSPISNRFTLPDDIALTVSPVIIDGNLLYVTTDNNVAWSNLPVHPEYREESLPHETIAEFDEACMLRRERRLPGCLLYRASIEQTIVSLVPSTANSSMLSTRSWVMICFSDRCIKFFETNSDTLFLILRSPDLANDVSQKPCILTTNNGSFLCASGAKLTLWKPTISGVFAANFVVPDWTDSLEVFSNKLIDTQLIAALPSHIVVQNILQGLAPLAAQLIDVVHELFFFDATEFDKPANKRHDLTWKMRELYDTYKLIYWKIYDIKYFVHALQMNAQVPLHKYGVIIEEDHLNEYDLQRLIVKTSYDIYFLLFRRPIGGVKEYRISATSLTVDNGWDDLSPEAMEIILQILNKFGQTNWKWGSDSSIIQINLHLVESLGITSYLKLRDDIIDALDRPEYHHLFSIAKAEETADRIVDSKEDMLVASTSPSATAQAAGQRPRLLPVQVLHPWYYNTFKPSHIDRVKLLASLPSNNNRGSTLLPPPHIAIIDTGYHPNPLIPSNSISSFFNGLEENYSDKSEWTTARDLHGHGTAMVGQMIGHAYGVTDGRDDLVQLHVLKAADADDTMPQALVIDRCFQHLLAIVPENEFCVVSISLHVVHKDFTQKMHIKAYRSIQQQLQRNPIRAQNMIIILPTGNTREDIDFYDGLQKILLTKHLCANVIFATASDQDGHFCMFSSYGSKTVCVMAPGENITVPVLPTSVGNNVYQRSIRVHQWGVVKTGLVATELAGTSYSVSFIAILAALTKVQNPTWDAQQVIASILDKPNIGTLVPFHFPYAENQTSSQASSQNSSDDTASIHQTRNQVISMDCPTVVGNLFDTIIIHDDAVASAKSTNSSDEQSHQDTPANDQRNSFSDLDLFGAEINERENDHNPRANAAISNTCGFCCIM